MYMCCARVMCGWVGWGVISLELPPGILHHKQTTYNDKTPSN